LEPLAATPAERAFEAASAGRRARQKSRNSVRFIVGLRPPNEFGGYLIADVG
jgi:hypothetical protein